MFYLLENNKIIDSRIPYTANFPYWEIKDNCLFAKSKNDKLVRPYYKNKIKNQSENVLDLIEEGDLIRCERCDGIFEVSDINLLDEDDKERYACDKSFISYPANADHLENEISAIYKPDFKGNYIKVWEVKEDENN